MLNECKDYKEIQENEDTQEVDLQFNEDGTVNREHLKNILLED